MVEIVTERCSLEDLVRCRKFSVIQNKLSGNHATGKFRNIVEWKLPGWLNFLEKNGLMTET